MKPLTVPKFDQTTYKYLGEEFISVTPKKRTIGHISHAMQEIKAVRTGHLKNRWTNWWNQGSQLKKFWGLDCRSPVNDRILFDFSHGEGYSEKYIHEDDHELMVQTATDDELCLMMANPKRKKLISERIRGLLPVIPLRQDLVDEYLKLHNRNRHVYAVSQSYCTLLTKFARDKFDYLYKEPWRSETLVILDVEGDRYHFMFQPQKGFELLSDTTIATVSKGEFCDLH